jgi:hypothetical protein
MRTPRRGIVAIAAAAVAVAIPVSVRLSDAPAPQRIAQAADTMATALCSTGGPGGQWTISTTATATLLPAGTGPAAPGPCASVSLPDAGQASAIQECATALQAAQQEAASVLFSEFMTNLIQNNASRWASALTSQGYQGSTPSAGSQQVTDAINQVADSDNALAQALADLLNHSFSTTLDCSAGADSVTNWYSNQFQALADDETEANLVNQALNTVARQLAQAAQSAAAAFGGNVTPPGGPAGRGSSGSCEGSPYSQGTKGNHKIVIGEDQAGRVIPAANALGASYLNLTNAPTTDWLTINVQWINDCMNEGFTIYDIGPAKGRAKFPDATSMYYSAELEQIKNRSYPTTPYSQNSVTPGA